MEFSVSERLVLMDILPKEGSFVTLKILREAKVLLGFSNEEIKVLEISQKGEIVKWNKTKDIPKKFSLGEIATTLIRTALEELDKANKLKEEHITLYDKFVKEVK